MHYIGIDFHKESTHVVVLSEAGKLLERTWIPKRREELVRFLTNRPEPAKAALEATLNWYWAYDTIEPLVEELKLASPPKIRNIAESTVKTDHIDAKVIADLLRSNFLPTCYVPDAETRQKRELLRHRAFLIQIRTRVKNRIHIILDKLGIEHPFDNLFSEHGLEFLRALEMPWAYRRS